MKPKTAAVVVTYNRKELLKKCLKALLSQTLRCDVYVIDNASTDGTEDMIREFFSESKVSYFNTGENLGGAGGFEYGLKKAVEARYEYAWLMDDDTIPQRRSLEMLLRADCALKGKWGILSSVVRWSDGSMCKANRQKKTLFTFVKDVDIRNRKLIRAQMVSMVSLLVKTDVVRECGLPKGEYFIWTDDYDFSGRISRKYPIYVVTSSVVIHEMKENKKANFAIEKGDRIDRYQYLFRNDVDCYRQFGLKGWTYIILKDVYSTVNILLRAREEKGRKIVTIWKGFAKGLKFQPQSERV